EIKHRLVHANPFHQSYWLTRRYMDIKLSDFKNLGLIALQPILIAFLIIFAFENLIEVSPVNGNQVIESNATDDFLDYEENHVIAENESGEPIQTGKIGALFIMAIAAIWFGVSNAAKEIVGELSVFRRERMFNLQLTPYITSKVIVLTFLSFVQICIFLFILFLHYEDLQFFVETGVFLLWVSIVSIVFGLMLSSITNTSTEVMSILPIALMPQIILAGIIQPIQNDITVLLSYLTIGRWGTEGLARIQDIGRDNELFLKIIDIHLYQHNSFLASDGLFNNLFILSLLLIAMLLVTYHFLNSK
ncbi:MAG: ABC transporter permease, partial [Chitinophagaceae bacterium]